MQQEGGSSEGGLFSPRLDCYCWCSPAPCPLHTGFHNEWPGKDTRCQHVQQPSSHTAVGTAQLDFTGWSQRRAASSRMTPKELLCAAVVLAFPERQLLWFWFDSTKLLSCCMICKICIIWVLEGTLEVPKQTLSLSNCTIEKPGRGHTAE